MATPSADSNVQRGAAATLTRSDKIVRALRARGGRASLDILTEDLARTGFPRREILPAATIALLGGRIRRVADEVVEVVE